MKVSAGVETWSSNWYIFFLNSCNFLKQEGTGNLRESIKKAKKVHILSLCGRRYYFISKGIISKQCDLSSFFEFKLLFF